MSPVWLVAAQQLRRRWRSWLGLALVVAIGGGVVLAALTSARRTDSAYPRFVARHRAADVVVPGANPFGLVGGVDLNVVRRMPEVADAATVSVALLFTGRTDRGVRLDANDIFPTSSVEQRLGTDIERWRLLRGRRANPDRIDEVVVSFEVANQLKLDVGSTFTLHFFRADTFPEVAAKLLAQFGERLQAGGAGGATAVDDLADGPRIEFRVVGVEASPAEFPPVQASLSPPVHLTPAFHRAHGDRIVGTPVMFVKLRNGTEDLPSFRRRVELLAGTKAASIFATLQSQTQRVQRGIRIEATAARLVAVITALALIVVVGQGLSRQSLLEAGEDDTLRSLGMTTSQLSAMSFLRSAVVALTGAAGAVLLAIAVSPLTPIGLAATAEPDPGLRVDVPVLALGGAAIFAAVLLLDMLGALLRRPRVLARRRRRSPVARQVPVGGLPPAGAAGLRFAFDRGRGAAAVPVSATLVGVAVATTILSGVAAFNASLDRLVNTPRLYGWNWSTYSGAAGLPDIGDALIPALELHRGVVALGAGTVSQVDLEDVRIDVLAVDDVKGTISPPMIEGRAPIADDEVAVGTTTLRALDKGIGDTVVGSLGSRRQRYRIVGRIVLPDLGDFAQLGTGAMMSFSGLQHVVGEARRNVFLVRFDEAEDPDRAVAVLHSALAPLPTREAERPADLAAVTRVNSLPNILTLVLVVLAAAVLAQTILTSVRQRRRDLAVLKAVGLLRRQVAAVVFAQATALTVVPLVIGVPVGVAAGRWAWVLLADRLGVVAEPAFPVLALAVLVPGALLMVNLLATVPAVIAGRTPAAVVLRAE